MSLALVGGAADVRGDARAGDATGGGFAGDAATVFATLRDTGRSAGLAEALAAAADLVVAGSVPFGPAGHAVVAGRTLASASGWWRAGCWGPDVDELGVAVLGRIDLPGGAIATLQLSAQCVADTADTSDTADTAGSCVRTAGTGTAPWLTALAAARLGVSEALRDTCRAYLARRRVGQGVALHQQLVRADLARAAIAHEEAAAVLAAASGRELRTALRLHRSVSDADGLLAPLLGGSGYLLGSAGHVADVSHLVADAYCPAARS